MANPITNLDPVLPPFRDGIQDQNDKLNALYEFFEQGPFNAVPTSGGTMTGPLHLEVALAVDSGGTGGNTPASARAGIGAAGVAELAAPGGAALVGNTPAGNISAVATTVQAAINELDADLSAFSVATGTALAGKEPTIAAATVTPAAKYWRGDKTWQDLGSAAIASLLTGLSTAVSSAVAATDSILTAIGKLQAQSTATQNRIGDAGGFTFRNRIINGACLVAQRPNLTLTAGGGYGGPDRFYMGVAGSAGGSLTQSQGSLTQNSVVKSTVRQTVNTPIASMTGTNMWQGLLQVMEGVSIFDLKGKSITVSFWFNTNVSGTYSAALIDPANNSFLTSFTAVANTPVKVSFTTVIPTTSTVAFNGTAGIFIAVGALNQGTYQAAVSPTWTTTTYKISATGATNWGATAGNFIELTELQIEAGSKATEFEYRPWQAELNLCYRYCQTITGGGYIGQGLATGATAAVIAVILSVKFRSTPVLSVPSFSSSDYAVTTQTTSQNLVGFTIQSSTSGCVNFLVTGNGSASWTAGQPCFMQQGGGLIILSSEL